MNRRRVAGRRLAADDPAALRRNQRADRSRTAKAKALAARRRVKTSASFTTMDLNAIPIEFDLMHPAFAAGHLLDGGSERGLDEAGEGRLDADSRRFLRWNVIGTSRNRKV
jgi:hypothetical protein